MNLNLGEKRESVCSYSSLVPITRLSAALKAARERGDSLAPTGGGGHVFFGSDSLKMDGNGRE